MLKTITNSQKRTHFILRPESLTTATKKDLILQSLYKTKKSAFAGRSNTVRGKGHSTRVQRYNHFCRMGIPPLLFCLCLSNCKGFFQTLKSNNMQTQVFSFEQENVMDSLTTINIDGEIWFVAADVCRMLGLDNPTVAIKSLDEDEKLPYVLHRAGQDRKVSLINESGLYNLVFKSRKDSAVRFRKWVTKVVLPQIRKTGSFGIDRSALPNFMKRYQLNWAKTDKGYFSVIALLYPTLYAALERHGYSIPDRGEHEKEIRPDVSVGLLFSKYLQAKYPHLCDRHRLYEHTFPDGFKVDCRQYPNDMMHIFIQFVEDEWIPKRASGYFADRDRKALDYLPKLITKAA